jgi:hypothetical protein
VTGVSSPFEVSSPTGFVIVAFFFWESCSSSISSWFYRSGRIRQSLLCLTQVVKCVPGVALLPETLVDSLNDALCANGIMTSRGSRAITLNTFLEREHLRLFREMLNI